MESISLAFVDNGRPFENNIIGISTSLTAPVESKAAVLPVENSDIRRECLRVVSHVSFGVAVEEFSIYTIGCTSHVYDNPLVLWTCDSPLRWLPRIPTLYLIVNLKIQT